MEPILVNTPNAAYPIYIENSFTALQDALKKAKLQGRKICIVTDRHVADLHLLAAQEAIAAVSLENNAFIFEAGEKSKQLDTVTNLYQFMLNHKLDRGSVVLALGGGVTGDMAGFAAATYMRGVSFVQVPTTLLAQVDASVGGKTAVDFKDIKNLIGAFYQPKFVYINLKTLDTLPHEERVSGMGEVAKHGLIDGGEYYAFLRNHAEACKRLDEEAMREVVAGSCRIKAAIVSHDEKESGLREILNLGHTFGHAIESFCQYAIPHGSCVSIGLCAALYLSYRMGHLTKTSFGESVAFIQNLGLPVRMPGLDLNALFQLMAADKKNRNNKIRLVLLKGVGGAYTEENADENMILEALQYVLAEKA